jgi:hypothetical protein
MLLDRVIIVAVFITYLKDQHRKYQGYKNKKTSLFRFGKTIIVKKSLEHIG